MAIERTLVILKPDARAPREPGQSRVEENAAVAEKIFADVGLKKIGEVIVKRDDNVEKKNLKPNERPVEVIKTEGEPGNQLATLGPDTLKKLFSAFYIEHLFGNRNQTISNYYPDLVDLMSSGQTVVMVLEGENAIKAVRDKLGHRSPEKWQPGEVRHAIGDPNSETNNGIHASDSLDAAQTEIRFFQKNLKLALPPELVVSTPAITGNAEKHLKIA